MSITRFAIDDDDDDDGSHTQTITSRFTFGILWNTFAHARCARIHNQALEPMHMYVHATDYHQYVCMQKQYTDDWTLDAGVHVCAYGCEPRRASFVGPMSTLGSFRGRASERSVSKPHRRHTAAAHSVILSVRSFCAHAHVCFVYGWVHAPLSALNL